MNESTLVGGALESPAVHERWLNDLYKDDSRVLYDRAFDHIVEVFGSRPKSTVLDAGCGAGSHAIRLALRGYPVLAMDFSEYILERARANVAAHGLNHMVTFSHGSASSLPMQDGAFELDEGLLLSRVARISWLVARVADHGLELEERIAFELLDPHIVPGSALKRCVPGVNRFWFERVRFAPLAMNNLLIFRRRAYGLTRVG